ncbi:MAG TPA: pyruvate kinase [Polyangia bacterium]|jgi:pyruvate kinase
MAFVSLDAPRAGAFQLVATLGPASLDCAPALAAAGATSFRLNASHLSPAAAAAAVAQVRQALPDAPLVVDLQGAKMRLGVLPERPVRAGDTVRFAAVPGPGAVPLPHPELFAAVRPGETLSCDDDRLRFRVRAVAGEELEAVALTDGPLRPRKGVNVVEHPVELEDLSPSDRGFLDALEGVPGLAFAYSFMQDGAEAAWLRRRAPGAPVVGKIERAEAVTHLAAIDARVDVVWICRGDLGAQLGMAALGRLVGGLDPRALRRPALMAGQVLEHLTTHPEPTRSEVCHLHDLVARGYAGLVLSDETAIGRDPAAAVARAAELWQAFRARAGA